MLRRHRGRALVRVRALALVSVAASFVAAAAPSATAAENCVGEQSLYVCVITPDVTVGERDYCIYAGGTQCIPVTLPDPSVSGQAGYTCTTTIYFTADFLPHTPCHLLP